MNKFWIVILILLTGCFEFGNECSFQENKFSGVTRICVENDSIKSYAKYDSLNNLRLKGHKYNNKWDGEFITYYPNGKIETKGIMKEGLWNGFVEGFYPNGNKQIIGTQIHNQWDGELKVFHSNGFLKTNTKTILGKLWGNYMEYDTLGKLINYKFNRDSIVLFERNYNNKKILSEGGDVVEFKYERISLGKIDSFFINIETINPPYSLVNLYIGDSKTTLERIIDFNGTYVFKGELKSEEIKTFLIKVDITNDDLDFVSPMEYYPIKLLPY